MPSNNFITVMRTCRICQRTKPSFEFPPKLAGKRLRICSECKSRPRKKVGPKDTSETRFWAKVNKTESCWLWTGTILKCGYGMLSVGEKNTLAHRFSYSMLVGAVSQGLCLDHLCVGSGIA